MDRNSIDWKGYWPASPTPFKENGDLDLETFGKLVDWYLECGMNGIFVNGTTGEWFSQSISERMQVLEFVLAEVKNRVPVVVGVGLAPGVSLTDGVGVCEFVVVLVGV